MKSLLRDHRGANSLLVSACKMMKKFMAFSASWTWVLVRLNFFWLPVNLPRTCWWYRCADWLANRRTSCRADSVRRQCTTWSPVRPAASRPVGEAQTGSPKESRVGHEVGHSLRDWSRKWRTHRGNENWYWPAAGVLEKAKYQTTNCYFWKFQRKDSGMRCCGMLQNVVECGCPWIKKWKNRGLSWWYFRKFKRQLVSNEKNWWFLWRKNPNGSIINSFHNERLEGFVLWKRKECVR